MASRYSRSIVRLRAGGTIHRLRIDHAGDPDLGALHSIDAPLLFGTYGDGGPGERMAGNTPRAEEVSKSFMNVAAAFEQQMERMMMKMFRKFFAEMMTKTAAGDAP